MPTAKKRYLRKKRFHLRNHQVIALFNGSNLPTIKINKIKLLLQNADLYCVPSYLLPPKIAKGCPLLVIAYASEKDLKDNLPNILTKLDCLGVFIKESWYPLNVFNKNKLRDLNKKLLGLFLLKQNQSK